LFILEEIIISLHGVQVAKVWYKECPEEWMGVVLIQEREDDKSFVCASVMSPPVKTASLSGRQTRSQHCFSGIFEGETGSTGDNKCT